MKLQTAAIVAKPRMARQPQDHQVLNQQQPGGEAAKQQHQQQYLEEEHEVEDDGTQAARQPSIHRLSAGSPTLGAHAINGRQDDGAVSPQEIEPQNPADLLQAAMREVSSIEREISYHTSWTGEPTAIDGGRRSSSAGNSDVDSASALGSATRPGMTAWPDGRLTVRVPHLTKDAVEVIRTYQRNAVSILKSMKILVENDAAAAAANAASQDEFEEGGEAEQHQDREFGDGENSPEQEATTVAEQQPQSEGQSRGLRPATVGAQSKPQKMMTGGLTQEQLEQKQHDDAEFQKALEVHQSELHGQRHRKLQKFELLTSHLGKKVIAVQRRNTLLTLECMRLLRHKNLYLNLGYQKGYTRRTMGPQQVAYADGSSNTQQGGRVAMLKRSQEFLLRAYYVEWMKEVAKRAIERRHHKHRRTVAAANRAVQAMSDTKLMARYFVQWQSRGHSLTFYKRCKDRDDAMDDDLRQFKEQFNREAHATDEMTRSHLMAIEDEHQAEMDSMNSTIEELRAALRQRDEELADAHSNSKSLQDQLDASESVIEELRSQVHELQQHRLTDAAGTKQIHDLSETCAQLQEQLDRSNQLASNLTTEQYHKKQEASDRQRVMVSSWIRASQNNYKDSIRKKYFSRWCTRSLREALVNLSAASMHSGGAGGRGGAGAGAHNLSSDRLSAIERVDGSMLSHESTVRRSYIADEHTHRGLHSFSNGDDGGQSAQPTSMAEGLGFPEEAVLCIEQRLTKKLVMERWRGRQLESLKWKRKYHELEAEFGRAKEEWSDQKNNLLEDMDRQVTETQLQVQDVRETLTTASHGGTPRQGSIFGGGGSLYGGSLLGGFSPGRELRGGSLLGASDFNLSANYQRRRSVTGSVSAEEEGMTMNIPGLPPGQQVNSPLTHDPDVIRPSPRHARSTSVTSASSRNLSGFAGAGSPTRGLPTVGSGEVVPSFRESSSQGNLDESDLGSPAITATATFPDPKLRNTEFASSTHSAIIAHHPTPALLQAPGAYVQLQTQVTQQKEKMAHLEEAQKQEQLSHEKELSSLQEQLTTMKHNYESTRTQLEQSRSQLTQLHQEQQEESARAAQRLNADAQSALNHERKEKEQTIKRLELQHEVQLLELRREMTKTLMDQHEGELINLNRERNEARSEVDRLENKLKHVERNHDDEMRGLSNKCKAAEKELEGVQAELKQALLDHSASTARYQDEHQRLHAIQNSKLVDSSADKKEKEELRKKIAQLEQDMDREYQANVTRVSRQEMQIAFLKEDLQAKQHHSKLLLGKTQDELHDERQRAHDLSHHVEHLKLEITSQSTMQQLHPDLGAAGDEIHHLSEIEPRGSAGGGRSGDRSPSPGMLADYEVEPQPPSSSHNPQNYATTTTASSTTSSATRRSERSQQRLASQENRHQEVVGAVNEWSSRADGVIRGSEEQTRRTERSIDRAERMISGAHQLEGRLQRQGGSPSSPLQHQGAWPGRRSH